MKTIQTNQNDDSEDDVLRLMRNNRIPLTRQNYLEIAFGGEAPKNLHPEHEAMLPDMFKNNNGAD